MYADGFTLRWKLVYCKWSSFQTHGNHESFVGKTTAYGFGDRFPPNLSPKEFSVYFSWPADSFIRGETLSEYIFAPSDAMICLLLCYKYVQSIAGWVSEVLLLLQVSFWECMNETLEGEYEKL
jgi:hypothetical protein